MVKKSLLPLILVLCVYQPLYSQSELDTFFIDIEEGRAEGYAAGQGDPHWYWAGFGLNVVGLFLPLLLEPEIPALDLVGKSPAYVQGYMEGYKERARSENMTQAALGCGTSSLTGCLLYMGYIAVLMPALDSDFKKKEG